METISRFLNIPKQSFFLFGPRGTGKTLWVKKTFKNAVVLDFLQPDIYRTYIAKPERLIELVNGNPNIKTFILDEVQKIPAILSVVHLLIEKNKNMQFVLTGSSARKIKRSNVDLLGGRAVLRNLYPFIASELGNKFSFKKALNQGLLPLVFGSKNPIDTLKAYIGLYLQEEVQAEALVRNIGNFSRFLEAISFSHASVLNLSNIARECEIGRKTVEGYLDVLLDLLLGYKIDVFNKKAKRSLSKHQKFYFFDSGVFISLRPKGPLDNVDSIVGSALEGLIFQHLKTWNSYRNNKNDIYYWRTRSGLEVDFIIYGEDGLYAIEVKSSQSIHPQDIRGLKAFKEDYPQAETILLYNGKEKIKKDFIYCIPCEEFLKNLHPSKNII